MIIDEPWIGLIPSGNKTWEMRRTVCYQRGQIALIRKGSGQVVGVREISGSLPPLADLDGYQATEPKHCIPPSRQARAFEDRWRTPWIVENARPLARSVAYAHPSGAVTWSNLGPDAAAAIAAQLDGNSAPQAPEPAAVSIVIESRASTQSRVQPEATNASQTSERAVRDVTITGGNLRNAHIYLPLDFFPADAIGGSNKVHTAPMTITVTFQPGATVQTDIDRTKRMLRARAQVGDFLARSGVMEGNAVRITRTGQYVYEFSKVTDV